MNDFSAHLPDDLEVVGHVPRNTEHGSMASLPVALLSLHRVCAKGQARGRRCGCDCICVDVVAVAVVGAAAAAVWRVP